MTDCKIIVIIFCGNKLNCYICALKITYLITFIKIHTMKTLKGKCCPDCISRPASLALMCRPRGPSHSANTFS